MNVGLQIPISNSFKCYVCDAVMVANIEIRGVDSQSCHFIWGLMLGYYDVEDTWPQFNRTKQALRSSGLRPLFNAIVLLPKRH